MADLTGTRFVMPSGRDAVVQEDRGDVCVVCVYEPDGEPAYIAGVARMFVIDPEAAVAQADASREDRS